jgi:hypothetical protein
LKVNEKGESFHFWWLWWHRLWCVCLRHPEIRDFPALESTV